MLSLADASGQKTALVALRNCVYLIPLGFLAYDCESEYSQTITFSFSNLVSMEVLFVL